MAENKKEEYIEYNYGTNQESDEQDQSDTKEIHSDKGDIEVASLYNKHIEGDLILQPDFQREFVWDKKKCCQLIESILLDIPIPTIYLAEQEDGKENVIDGQQRLTSLFSFIAGKFINGDNENENFKFTTHLEKFKQYNNKMYKDLDKSVRKKISGYLLRVITFKKSSDKTSQFEIFARLNRGAASINEQELRNCIYRGKFNKLIKELSENKDFQKLLGLTRPHKRMLDKELVLRFAAFYLKHYQNYTSPIKKFLNDTMIEYSDESLNEHKEKALENLKNAFKQSVSLIKTLFDDKAFKKFNIGNAKKENGNWDSKVINISIFDVLMYSLAKRDRNAIQKNIDIIREAFIDLMTYDEEFIESIEKSTSSKKAVNIRFDKWEDRLNDIVNIYQKETRCFSYKLKEELFKKDSTCELCKNKIQNIDDAALDHIEQYWLGGKTIPNNARLTHRYCNANRSRKTNFINYDDLPDDFSKEKLNLSGIENSVFKGKKIIDAYMFGDPIFVNSYRGILEILVKKLYDKSPKIFIDDYVNKILYIENNIPKDKESQYIALNRTTFAKVGGYSADDTMKKLIALCEMANLGDDDLQVVVI